MTDTRDPYLPTIEEANREYAAAQLPSLAGRPAKQLCILTCMDARLDLYPALGLARGDAHFLRNAGGRVTDDALRSLALSAHALGTREYAVIHHTKCGLHNAANDALQQAVSEGSGGDASHIDFLPFDDLDGSVRDDVQAVLDCGLLPPGSVVWGATLDVDSGALNVVVPPTPASATRQ